MELGSESGLNGGWGRGLGVNFNLRELASGLPYSWGISTTAPGQSGLELLLKQWSRKNINFSFKIYRGFLKYKVCCSGTKYKFSSDIVLVSIGVS